MEFFELVREYIDGNAVIDVTIVTVLIYVALIFVKETKSFFIFTTVAALAGMSYLSGVFDLTLTSNLLQPFLTFVILIIVIVFQREIRRFFEWFSISGTRLASSNRAALTTEVANEIVETVHELVKRKIGALVVLSGDLPVERAIEGGVRLDGKISSEVLLSIFDPSSPGHDGAVVIVKNRIRFFGVHLPLGEKNPERLNKFGTRHRAAVGLTEETDAMVIVVSEERGIVSIARNGILREVSRERFSDVITNFMQAQSERVSSNNIWRYLIAHNWVEKVSALMIAVILWATLTR